MWGWVGIPRPMEAAAYYPTISSALLSPSPSEGLEAACHEFVFLLSYSIEISAFAMFVCPVPFPVFQLGSSLIRGSHLR
ncbi:hypothetical protein DSO57_1007875 [Entomophthora muscae]|uniref:Uncharacterized protein n=1 Tax=Entomophthora muscae TaxID=34485 RepID=A0ACC2SJX7_9FUNG|nr:hypothetical protein DSO57_1007875 [Entomophthora muscae]